MTTSKPELPNNYYRVSTKAIIRRGDKILLVREHSSYWILPGGGLDHGESPEAGLRRELAEELALGGAVRINPTPSHVGFGAATWDDMPFPRVHLCFICYEVEVDGKIEPGPEIRQADFFGAGELRGEMLPEDEGPTIRGILDL